MFHICMSFSSPLRLTWLTDPALVTSVYPNRMQYMPHVLQEASLLDGVDAGVRGNGRRFSKTSSYPPCHCYAFILFYLYFLTMSLSPLFQTDSLLSHNPLYPCLTLQILPRSLSPLFPYCPRHLAKSGNVFYLRQNNVVKNLSWPLSYLV